MASFKDKLKAHLTAAKAYSTLSYANRLKVGALIIKEDRVVSIGVNGTPKGFSNVCEDVDGNTRPEVVHAEANAILFAAKIGISTQGAIMVTTDSPCYECAKMIKTAGISQLFYSREYRDTAPLKFLQAVDVNIERITI